MSWFWYHLSNWVGQTCFLSSHRLPRAQNASCCPPEPMPWSASGSGTSTTSTSGECCFQCAWNGDIGKYSVEVIIKKIKTLVNIHIKTDEWLPCDRFHFILIVWLFQNGKDGEWCIMELKQTLTLLSKQFGVVTVCRRTLVGYGSSSHGNHQWVSSKQRETSQTGWTVFSVVPTLATILVK